MNKTDIITEKQKTKNIGQWIRYFACVQFYFGGTSTGPKKWNIIVEKCSASSITLIISI